MITRPRRWRYTVQDTDRHGTVRTYLRLPGRPKLRLRAEPGTDEFEAEYKAALAAPAKPAALVKPPIGAVVPGSIDALVIAYYASAAFQRMDARSQRVRRGILDRFRMENGAKSAERLQPHHLVRIRDAMAATPEAANALLKALRAAFKAGEALRLVTGNPAVKVSYLPSANPEGIHAWTLEEVEQFEAKHPVGSMARLALALLLYTGQRRSDVVLLGRQHLRDGALTFTQQKNRARRPVRLVIPVLPELARIIEATPSGSLAFLTSERGTAFTPDSFGNRFRKWCREAGLPHCSAHGLRKATASRLAEMGATPHQIMAVTGHRTLKEVDRYTRAATQRAMAESAMALMARHEKSHQGAATPGWDETEAQGTDSKGRKRWMVPRAGIKRTR
jgi:integrase